MKLSQRAFATALRGMRKPGGRQLDFLKAHERAKGRASTMRQLARRVHYASWRPMNLLYGLLARDIGRAAGIRNANIRLLVDFVAPVGRSPENLSNSEWILVMREPFAKALRVAGWI